MGMLRCDRKAQLVVIAPGHDRVQPFARAHVARGDRRDRDQRELHARAHLRQPADVADVRVYMSGCAVMAVPLRVGGGSRLKILEALAARLPVVSTTLGAEGLHLTPNVHLFLADEPEGFAQALVRILRDPAASVSMAWRARDEVARRHDWSYLAAKLEKIWERAMK